MHTEKEENLFLKDKIKLPGTVDGPSHRVHPQVANNSCSSCSAEWFATRRCITHRVTNMSCVMFLVQHNHSAPCTR